jgi:hypothetical protein
MRKEKDPLSHWAVYFCNILREIAKLWHVPVIIINLTWFVDGEGGVGISSKTQMNGAVVYAP